ncbi:MOSC domain-containing protein [Helcobacillus massiliensis]|uniref:MOSC domain-containing protein YiiM n=1 Tax=Helcobacillus massiliensis TaxID=521392 RepID=A0A839R1Q6_9MICO|nr:MOSC domain-containing protein [Helcobacillus massiliensis]MBB3022536.1 MOSC domain-containing protein YiiM [Helcobacillus massiliensis]MDK7741239.1 MOSC domain-containing protein [Helcobacillus massiliensis]WOO94044.1 MOSC domain-containing protein [Helcobacillus massiliensis]
MTATPIAGTLAAVCLPRELFAVTTRGRLISGIAKEPVEGPVEVLSQGIWGDVQGDRQHHGGTFKAVYAYAREQREALAESLGREFPDGFFGENLVTTGIDTDGAVIGERWRIGTTVLEASCVRTPCATLAERTGDPRFGRRFTDHGMPGAYFRVIEEGEILARQDIEVISRPDHGVTLRDAFRGLTADQASALLDWSEESATVLYSSLVKSAQRTLAKAGLEHFHPARLSSDGRGI